MVFAWWVFEELVDAAVVVVVDMAVGDNRFVVEVVVACILLPFHHFA